MLEQSDLSRSFDQSSKTARERYDEDVMPIAKGYDPFVIERASDTTMT